MAYIPPRGVATGGISGQGPQGVSTVRGGGAVVPPRKVKVAPKTVPGAPAGPNKAALIAKYIAGLRSGAGTGGGGIPDMSGGIPGAPGFGLYTGNTVPDYGAQVPNSEFPGFKQGAASSVDPRAYARIAGQAYTPMLDELRRQQQGYQAGQVAGNAQIESAYGTASDLATQSRDRILQSGANTAAANNTANANLV